jgi:hypothetical protein
MAVLGVKCSLIFWQCPHFRQETLLLKHSTLGLISAFYTLRIFAFLLPVEFDISRFSTGFPR